MSPVPEPNDDRLSALADGRLQGDAFAQLVTRLAEDPQAANTWHMYHLIGDVLRSEALAPSPADLSFCARFEVRLAAEPVRSVAPSSSGEVQVTPRQGAANASVWRWRVASGAMFAVLVAVVGLDHRNQIAPQTTLALAVPVPAETQIMIRDPQLDALLEAHQQLGGYSALQRPAGFLRNATFERPAR
jgi:sigma-E factor negative regulatory protein RseA